VGEHRPPKKLVRQVSVCRPFAGFGANRKSSTRTLVIGCSQTDLAEVVGAGRAADSFAGRLKRRKKDSHEDAKEGDHDENFDERETM
jgi:hypothetical protein